MTYPMILTRDIYRGATYRIVKRSSGSGLHWEIDQFDHLSRPLAPLTSGGCFYDGCDDHPEGARAWAEASVQRAIDKAMGRHPRDWPVGTRVRLDTPSSRRRNWPWILPPDGTIGTVALGPQGGNDVTWVPVGPLGQVFVRFDGEWSNDGLPVLLDGCDLAEAQ